MSDSEGATVETETAANNKSDIPPMPVLLGQRYGGGRNTSGRNATVPAKLQSGFNWGAFLLPWLWAINHRMVALGIGILVAEAGMTFVPLFGWLLKLILQVGMGIKGNEMAWRRRQFNSLEDFYACQRAWKFWGFGVVGVGLILSFAYYRLFPHAGRMAGNMGLRTGW